MGEQRVSRGPEGKTELPHKIGLRERVIDSKSRKMSCPSLRTVASVLSWVSILTGKGEAEMEEVYSRAGSGLCFSLVVSFLSLSLCSGKL